MARLPNVSELFGGDPAVCDGNPTYDSPHGRVVPAKVAKRNEALIKVPRRPRQRKPRAAMSCRSF